MNTIYIGDELCFKSTLSNTMIITFVGASKRDDGAFDVTLLFHFPVQQGGGLGQVIYRIKPGDILRFGQNFNAYINNGDKRRKTVIQALLLREITMDSLTIEPVNY